MSNNDLYCRKCKSQHHPVECPLDAVMTDDIEYPCCNKSRKEGKKCPIHTDDIEKVVELKEGKE